MRRSRGFAFTPSLWLTGGVVVLAVLAYGAWLRGSLHQERAERANERAAGYAAQWVQETRNRKRHERASSIAAAAAQRARDRERGALRDLRRLEEEIAADDPCRPLLDARICPHAADWMLEHAGAGGERVPSAPEQPDDPDRDPDAPGGG